MTNSACSDLFHESLPGTAKSGKLFVALEHPYGWSRDILDGGVFGDELTARIKAWLAERGGSLQLIRKSGRLGQAPCAGVTMYIAHCPPGVGFGGAGEGGGAGRPGPRLERMTVAGAEEMIGLDIRLGRPTDGAEEVDGPLLLVCTHGKRDVCCAVKGRPVALQLGNVHPDIVWETSHSKGHRFAPALVLLPWNYSYGRLSVAETDAVIRDAAGGVLHANGCRGRGVWDARGQVAELAAREEAGEWAMDAVAGVDVADVVGAVLADGEGTGDPEILDRLREILVKVPADAAAVVAFADGRRFGVTLEKTVTEGVISSCGDEPGPKKGWRATGAVAL